MLLHTRNRRPKVISRRGDSPTLERSAAEVCSGIEVGKLIVASSKEAPEMRTRENVTRNIQPLLGPKPWRTHKNIPKRQAGAYTMSSTMERSFRFDSVMTADNGKAAEYTSPRL